MISREIVINSETGLASKAAAMFIQIASNYKSNIWVEKSQRKANAKSLLGLLSLSIGSGSKVWIIAEGEDEESALAELCNYAEGRSEGNQ